MSKVRSNRALSSTTSVVMKRESSLSYRIAMGTRPKELNARYCQIKFSVLVLMSRILEYGLSVKEIMTCHACMAMGNGTGDSVGCRTQGNNSRKLQAASFEPCCSVQSKPLHFSLVKEKVPIRASYRGLPLCSGLKTRRDIRPTALSHVLLSSAQPCQKPLKRSWLHGMLLPFLFTSTANLLSP